MEPAVLQSLDQIESHRLVIRLVRPDDAREINSAVNESLDSLRPWMPWARERQSLAQTEEFCRRSAEQFKERTAIHLLLRLKPGGALAGGCGFHSIDWSVPKLEIGYWVNTRFARQGYITEAVVRLTHLAFQELGANRLEIRMDDRNTTSWRVAERAGFTLEGTLRNDERTASGELRDTRIYARVRLADGRIA